MPRPRIKNSVNQFAKSRFVFTMSGMDGVEFWCQELILPGVNNNEIILGTPTGEPMVLNGDTNEYGSLSGRFILDENLNNWAHMYRWAKGLTDGNKEIQGEGPQEFIRPSQLIVTILNSSSKPIKRITYKYAFPVNLGSIPLKVNEDEAEPVTIDFEMQTMSASIEDLV